MKYALTYLLGVVTTVSWCAVYKWGDYGAGSGTFFIIPAVIFSIITLACAGARAEHESR